MKSRKAKRMQKHHKRRTMGGLNLISLMDIFTILVFFLLVNSQEVETLPNAKDLQLPESYAEQKARENVVILITEEAIMVQGQLVATVDEVMNQDGVVIPALDQALRLQTANQLVEPRELEDFDDFFQRTDLRGILLRVAFAVEPDSGHGTVLRQ